MIDFRDGPCTFFRYNNTYEILYAVYGVGGIRNRNWFACAFTTDTTRGRHNGIYHDPRSVSRNRCYRNTFLARDVLDRFESQTHGIPCARRGASLVTIVIVTSKSSGTHDG